MTPSEFRAARKRLGLTRAALAEALGVTARTVGNWSWGHTEIPPFMWRALEHIERERAKDSPCVPD
jgi:DNA-binding transcriptional regulator YiaG